MQTVTTVPSQMTKKRPIQDVTTLHFH